MQIEAVVYTGVGEVRLQSMEMPPPAPGQVQVRTAYSSISAGTESWILKNEFTWSPTPYPCVPGYQRVGTITAVGEGVDGWKAGERVMAIAGDWPGSPESMWGAHLAVANTPVEHLFRLLDGVDPVAAAAGVVAQVGYNAASRATAPAGSWVVVYGDGVIGQSAAQAARARGYKVIVIGHRTERLELAARCSADFTINNHDKDVVQAVREHTNSETVAAILDTVQQPAAQKEYMPLLEPIKGEIVYSGFTPGTAWADMGLLQQKELTTHFVAGWTRPRMEATFSLMEAGKMQVRPLTTHLVPFTEAPAMYRMILEKSEPFMVITLDWTGAK